MLQPLKGDEYKIRVLKTRKIGRRTQYFVSYLGFGPKHNEWIDQGQLTADYRGGQGPVQQERQRQQNLEDQENELQRQHLEGRRHRRGVGRQRGRR